jgi:hypothetical protein
MLIVEISIAHERRHSFMWFHLLFMAASIVLLVFWFRYTCVLILSAGPPRDYGAAVARANALRFPEIQQKLAEQDSPEPAYLDTLRRALDRDYMLLTCLIRYGAQFRTAGQRMEHKMLRLNFQILRAWYAVSKRLSVDRRRRTLEQMVHILRHFAGMMGECSAVPAQ